MDADADAGAGDVANSLEPWWRMSYKYAYHDRELNDETRDCNKKNPNNNMDEK